MAEIAEESLMTLDELQERRNNTAGKKQMVLARLAQVKKMNVVLNKNLDVIRQQEEIYHQLEVAIKRRNQLMEAKNRR